MKERPQHRCMYLEFSVFILFHCALVSTAFAKHRVKAHLCKGISARMHFALYRNVQGQIFQKWNRYVFSQCVSVLLSCVHAGWVQHSAVCHGMPTGSNLSHVDTEPRPHPSFQLYWAAIKWLQTNSPFQSAMHPSKQRLYVAARCSMLQPIVLQLWDLQALSEISWLSWPHTRLSRCLMMPVCKLQVIFTDL